MAKKKKEEMFKTVQTLRYTDKLDSDLFCLVNNYAQQMKGISPTQAIRNYLLETLPQEIERKKQERLMREQSVKQAI